MPSDHAPSLPYADIAPVLLEVIYDSLLIIYTARFEVSTEAEMNKALVKCALKLKPKRSTRNNPHILEGVESSASGLPRVSRLCLEAVEHARNPAFDYDGESQRGIFVPSPLAILVNALTVPSCPESSAFGALATTPESTQSAKSAESGCQEGQGGRLRGGRRARKNFDIVDVELVSR